VPVSAVACMCGVLVLGCGSKAVSNVVKVPGTLAGLIVFDSMVVFMVRAW
jgi:hypothetical protein